ncbi:MAG TPA: helix-turn-helix domain-containing protein [Acidimicrobiales bacterium]|nr:helix-turn-helix domain-containing protein [Acidimicrobiales bacterium]
MPVERGYVEPGYVEWRPRYSPPDHVRCVWVSRPSGGPDDRVLPDACIDVVWDGARLFVAGPDTGPTPVIAPPGTAYAGVRFRPGRAPAFLGPPASALLDTRLDLADLWGEAVAARLAEELALATDPAAAAHALDRAVADRARAAGTDQARPSPDPMVDALVDLLWRQPPSMGAVHAASRQLSVGERRLYRRCCRAVGYGPKTLERVLRFQRALRLAGQTSSLAVLAARAGYADQAHLNRESRRLGGTTPSDLFKTGPAAVP